MSMPTGGPPEPDGLYFPVLHLHRADRHVTEYVRVPRETRRGVRGTRRTVAIYADEEWFHLLPGERSLWISMLDGRIVGIVE